MSIPFALSPTASTILPVRESPRRFVSHTALSSAADDETVILGEK